MNQIWSDLPNAHHIDWVVESVKNNPDLWAEAGAAAWNAAGAAAWNAAWDAAYDAARDAARSAAWNAAYDAAYDAARDAAGAAARNAAGAAARNAILALVAYDDCDQYLAMGYEKLQIWAALSEHPAAVLLLPMVYVREKLHEPALV